MYLCVYLWISVYLPLLHYINFNTISYQFLFAQLETSLCIKNAGVSDEWTFCHYIRWPFT